MCKHILLYHASLMQAFLNVSIFIFSCKNGNHSEGYVNFQDIEYHF